MLRMNIARFTDGAREVLAKQAEDYKRAGMQVTDKDRAEKLASWLHGLREVGPIIPTYPKTYTLNAGERSILWTVADHYGWDEWFWGFCHFASEAFPRSAVRRACRSLARKGLMRYQRGLLTEDGEAAGAGYGITDRGRSALGYICLLEGKH